MYIYPNSVITICKDVPLDNSYTDTLYFADRGAQHQTLASFGVRTFTQQSYQRVNKGTIRLQVLADDIYDCNYLMFQNTAYGNRWFYAFINQVRYINDAVSEIDYEIDVIQTWLLDLEIGPCFVEREHVTRDTVGLYTAPEPVDLGNIICRSMERPQFMNDLSIAVCYSDQKSDSGAQDVPSVDGEGAF